MIFGLLISLGYAGEVSEAVDRTYLDDEIVIESTRLRLEQQPTKTIVVDPKTMASKPSLETALQGQSQIQVVPTPLHGSNLSLNGLGGEHVALYWNQDPILGRIDGALDTRAIALEGVDQISVYQGLDSLPFGSQNIAGTISLESPWELSPLARFKFAAGNYGRTILSGSVARPNYNFGISNWRTEAVSNSLGDTSVDASARFSANAMYLKQQAFASFGKPVDVRIGGNGFHQNSKGVFAGNLSEGNLRRVHLFTDVRREKSNIHLSVSDFNSENYGDLYTERALRWGPTLQENFQNTTVFAGAMLDVHSTSSTRITSGQINRTTVGPHFGLRQVLSDHFIVGAGTRWDSGAKIWSPRAEIRNLFQTEFTQHTTVVESGLGFREVTPKEQYLDFSNPALRYRVLGNPLLQNENAWMTAVRHTISSKRGTLQASVFRMDVRDAIGFSPVENSPVDSNQSRNAVLSYSNIHKTRTLGLQWGGEYRFLKTLELGFNHQWLRGENLENGSPLFLQPEHRVTLSLGRNAWKGISFLSQAVWTGRQGFFDANRNRLLDESEWVSPFWMTNFEVGYGFGWKSVLSYARVFARVDNALNIFRVESFPVEPRTVLLGAMVEL